MRETIAIEPIDRRDIGRLRRAHRIKARHRHYSYSRSPCPVVSPAIRIIGEPGERASREPRRWLGREQARVTARLSREGITLTLKVQGEGERAVSWVTVAIDGQRYRASGLLWARLANALLRGGGKAMSKLLEELGIEPYAARSATEPHISLRKGGTVAINAIAQAQLGLQEGRRYRLGRAAENGRIYVAIYLNGPEKGGFKLSGPGFNAAGMFKAGGLKLDDQARPGEVVEANDETIILRF